MKEIAPSYKQESKRNESDEIMERDLEACLNCAKDLAGCQNCEYALGKTNRGETKEGEYEKNHPPHVENRRNNQ